MGFFCTKCLGVKFVLNSGSIYSSLFLTKNSLKRLGHYCLGIDALKFSFGPHGLSKLNFTMEDEAGNLVTHIKVVIQ